MERFGYLLAFLLIDMLGLPALWHVQRYDWISLDEVQAALQLNASHRAWLYDKRKLYPSQEWITEQIKEADCLYKAWDGLRDAKTHYYTNHLKRQGLQQVLNVVGPDMFLQGKMPWPLPCGGSR